LSINLSKVDGKRVAYCAGTSCVKYNPETSPVAPIWADGIMFQHNINIYLSHMGKSSAVSTDRGNTSVVLKNTKNKLIARGFKR
jgi:hypothetical protein